MVSHHYSEPGQCYWNPCRRNHDCQAVEGKCDRPDDVDDDDDEDEEDDDEDEDEDED